MGQGDFDEGRWGGEVHGAHAIQNKLDSLDMVEGTPDQKAWLQQVDNSDTLWLAAELLTRQGPALTAVRGVTLVQQDMTATGDSMVWDDDVELIHMWGRLNCGPTKTNFLATP